VIADKPGHTFKQITETWKSSGSGDLANFLATAVEQQDAVGGDMKVRGYGTAHNANGDLSYFSWEGTSKVTPKEGGAVELTGSGQFNWLGGAGKYQKISSQGTYTCKGNQAGVECPLGTPVLSANETEASAHPGQPFRSRFRCSSLIELQVKSFEGLSPLISE